MSKSSKDKFDLVVHRRDAKTGRVTSVNPYTMRKHHGVAYFERPKGSGNLYFENNEPAGRYVAGKFLPDAAHEAWVAPLTAEELVKQAVASALEETARLKAELNEIKREQKFKTEDAAAKPSAKLKKVLEQAEKSVSTQEK